MTTHAITCAICGTRFALDARAIPAQPTCSRSCRESLNRRRARRRALVAWAEGPIPMALQPNRIGAALDETRSAVTALQAEGRRLARSI
jgi:predicted nucleic acid-binding Zn ribbon protein